MFSFLQDDCSDHTGAGTGLSYWSAPATPDNSEGVSYSITLKLDVPEYLGQPLPEYHNNTIDRIDIVMMTIRNANCGTYNIW